MKLFSRAMKHLFTATRAGRAAFPERTLKEIQSAIAAGEMRHRAEVRLVVEPALDIYSVFRRMSSRERARELFSRYRIWDTEENCGVLIYVNLADHKVEIIADRGVGRALGAEQWKSVCANMTQGFSRGEFHDSSVAGLVRLNDLLAVGFPSDGSSLNELSNRPIVL